MLFCIFVELFSSKDAGDYVTELPGWSEPGL